MTGTTWPALSAALSAWARDQAENAQKVATLEAEGHRLWKQARASKRESRLLGAIAMVGAAAALILNELSLDVNLMLPISDQTVPLGNLVLPVVILTVTTFLVSRVAAMESDVLREMVKDIDIELRRLDPEVQLLTSLEKGNGRGMRA